MKSWGRAAALLAGILWTFVPWDLAHAEPARVEVAAQKLADALNILADQLKVQMVYDGKLVDGVQSQTVRGELEPEEALRRMLVGSGLTFRFVNSSTVTIERERRRGAQSEVRKLNPVRVEGVRSDALNGANGSRDITATEGTRSFTSGALTIGSKTAQSIKDTPQSVSVITAQRLEEQNIVDFTDAMAEAPGISLVQGTTSLENQFYSRGFAITTVQVDGGAPMALTLPNSTLSFIPLIDMAQYDHVEILRGAAGLLNGYGDPSGTVNLVRKKPLDHARVGLEMQAGSWERYRAVLDASAPLALDGKLRGRAVISYQDNEYFYDVAYDNRATLYGILQYDATSTTLLSAGMSYARQDSVPWIGGLPRYQNGDDLSLPRSTCLCFPWNRWDFNNTEIFGSVEQQIGDDWSAKLNLTHHRQDSIRKIGRVGGAVNPLTNAGPTLSASLNNFGSEQYTAEATLAGAFEVLGQRQEIVAGVNYAEADGGGRVNYGSLIAGTASQPYQPYSGSPLFCSSSSACPAGRNPPVDLFPFDPRHPFYTEPRNTLPGTAYPKDGRVQWGAYMNLRLTAFDRWHLVTGVRYSHYRNDTLQETLCTTNCAARGVKIGDVIGRNAITFSDHDITLPPSVSLSYDVTDSLSAYAGYTDIYQTQAGSLDRNLEPSGPLTGSNVELGIKWAPRGGKLNVTLATYRVEQSGFAVLDPNALERNPDGSLTGYILDNLGNRYPSSEIGPGIRCCFHTNLDATQLSRGVDLEVAGEVLTGWQLSASYTYNDNEYDGADLAFVFGNVDGKPLVTLPPKQLFKLWSSYRFPESGWTRGLTLSGGVYGQSKAFFAGTACAQLLEPNDLGVSNCAPRQDLPYSYSQEAYAVASARIDYRISDRWSAALNVDNLTDVRYYKTPGQSSGNNWYGEPRSYALTIRAQL